MSEDQETGPGEEEDTPTDPNILLTQFGKDSHTLSHVAPSFFSYKEPHPYFQTQTFFVKNEDQTTKLNDHIGFWFSFESDVNPQNETFVIETELLHYPLRLIDSDPKRYYDEKKMTWVQINKFSVRNREGGVLTYGTLTFNEEYLSFVPCIVGINLVNFQYSKEELQGSSIGMKYLNRQLS